MLVATSHLSFTLSLPAKRASWSSEEGPKMVFEPGCETVFELDLI